MEDDELAEKHLNGLEDPAQIIDDGLSLVEQCAENFGAADIILGVLSALGS